jgi:hypothetical protein
MTSRSRFGGARALALVCSASLAAGTMAARPASAQDEVEANPITCWWATDKTTLFVGERFTLTLTCGVVETSRVKVVADVNQLEPTAVSLAPFEVVGGTRHQDIQAPPWRYSQHEYTLRLMGEAFFGKDVDIPPLKVTYRIHSTIGGGAEGRDQTYLLPALPVRIMSLVPKKATDIRDGSHETFGDIEARRFRATAELVAAGIFFGFALVTLGLAGVRILGRSRARAGAVRRPLPSAAVLRGCQQEARRLKSDVAREGWTPETVTRALAMFRVAGAVALGRRVAQEQVDKHVAAREGQLVLRSGILRPKHALVSTPTTPKTMAKSVDDGNGLTVRGAATLAEIRNSLGLFSAARYGRNGHLETGALDAALDEGTGAIRRLRIARRWPARTATALVRTAATLGGTVWPR